MKTDTPLQSPCKSKHGANMNSEQHLSAHCKEIPPFSSTLYPRESCPAAAWFPIETCGPCMLKCSPPGKTHKVGEKHIELITPQTLDKLVAAFDASANGGRGLLLNECHLHEKVPAPDRAKGWLRAVHAHDEELWGYIELTPSGHKDLKEGYYWATSTEYNAKDFELVASEGTCHYWEPQKLAGLALTNTPAHPTQTGLVCHMKEQIHMPTAKTPRKKVTKQLNDAALEPESEEQLNTQEPLEQEEQLNSEEEPLDETQTNSEDAELLNSLLSFAEAVATELGADPTESPESILARLKKLNADYKAVNADAAKQTNSRMRWRVAARAYATAKQLNTGHTPQIGGKETKQLNSGETVTIDRASDSASRDKATMAKRRAQELGRGLTTKELEDIWNG